jgi:hypothetical protein
VCFVKIKRNDNFDPNSIKTIFLGYSSQSKGYKCYDPINKKLYISRDVIFVENESFYKEKEGGEIKEKEKRQSQDISHTIDQTNPVLPQLYGIDIIEHREQDDSAHAQETEPSVREEEIGENTYDSEGEMELRRS